MSFQDDIAALPHGLQRELTAAVERTGQTPELEYAARVLPVILKMTPEEFERYSNRFFQRT